MASIRETTSTRAPSNRTRKIFEISSIENFLNDNFGLHADVDTSDMEAVAILYKGDNGVHREIMAIADPASDYTVGDCSLFVLNIEDLNNGKKLLTVNQILKITTTYIEEGK